MKLFDNNELKLAILYCLEKTGMKNLWKEVKKVTKKPSYFYFIYIVCQIKKSGLYPNMKLQIKIQKSNAFYNMLFKHLIKYDYKIEKNRLLSRSFGSSLENSVFLPITNEKISHVIKKWTISKKLIKQFKKKYNLNKQKIHDEDYLLKYTLPFLIISYLHIIIILYIFSF